MQFLILIIAVVHSQGFNSHGFFRTRLTRQLNKLNDKQHDNINNRRLNSMQSLNIQHLNDKCNQPCQRKPYFVAFDSIMLNGHIQTLVGRSIRPKDGEYMVDIGICSGFCKKFQTALYSEIPVSSTIYQSSDDRHYRIDPISNQNLETRCIPISFESLDTDILINGKYEPGPRLENLVIKDCACSTIENCS